MSLDSVPTAWVRIPTIYNLSFPTKPRNALFSKLISALLTSFGILNTFNLGNAECNMAAYAVLREVHANI